MMEGISEGKGTSVVGRAVEWAVEELVKLSVEVVVEGDMGVRGSHRSKASSMQACNPNASTKRAYAHKGTLQVLL